MDQSLFNFNNLTVTLSAPPVFVSRVINLSSFIQGTTKIQLNYNNLFAFNVKALKTSIVWDISDSNAIKTINGVYSTDTLLDPLSTYSSMISGQSYYVYTPTQSQPYSTKSIYTIYFENGVILTYNNYIYISSDNAIDLDLNVLDVQNTYYSNVNVYNILSKKGGVVYNNTDLD